MFQSTPVIANGRIDRCQLQPPHPGGFNPRPLLLTGESLAYQVGHGLVMLFQSTPVIANGRIASMCKHYRKVICFNPRPLLLTGESIAA